MAKRFKLKLSCVIHSLQFCRSKNPSTFSETPISIIYRLSPINPKAFDISYPNNLPAPPSSTPENPPIKQHVSSKVASVDYRGSCAQYLSSVCSIDSPEYTWKKESSTRSHMVPSKANELPKARNSSFIAADSKSKEININEAKASNASSSDHHHHSGTWFFNSENNENETLISSSRSFSYDSSYEFDNHNFIKSTLMEISDNEIKLIEKKKVKKIRRLGRKGSNISKAIKTITSPETSGWVLQPKIPTRTVEGKVMRESVAVVKISKDPYEDFKRSMLEMILEKHIFEVEDLEELLLCFLSLNERQYHGAIVEAFAEIWKILFYDSLGKGKGVTKGF